MTEVRQNCREQFWSPQAPAGRKPGMVFDNATAQALDRKPSNPTASQVLDFRPEINHAA